MFDPYEDRDTCASCGEYDAPDKFWSLLDKRTSECESCYYETIENEIEAKKGIASK